MKIKHLFLAGLATLVLSACTNDNGQGNDSDKNMKGYISLSISAPQTTKTAQIGNADPSEGTESDIKNVTIVLTNSSGVVTEVVTVGMQTPTSTKTVPAKVSAGQHYVFALVNYQGANPSGLIQTVIDVASAEEATKGYKNGSFLMVNEFNGGSPSGPNGGVSITISETNNNTPETAAKALVKVDRVAVKIADKTDYQSNPPTITGLVSNSSDVIDEVSITGFALLNVNKQFNRIQNWGADGSLSTPLHTNPATNVSEQYFLNIGTYTKLTKDGSDKITEIKDISTHDNYILNRVIYSTENRPAFSALTNGEYTAGKGETTGVIYRVVAKKGGNDVGTFFKFGSIVTTNWKDITDANNSVPKTITSSDYPSIRAKGVQVYEDGIMYYSYFIKDVNTNHQLNGENYYGVFRNSSYKLKVNSFSNVGDDVPGGSINPVDPDPNVPTNHTNPKDPTNPAIDHDDAYITVDLTINPWILNEINIHF